MKKLFIWDFHGTLEKDNVMAVQVITNRVLHDYGKAKRLTLDEAVNLYGLSWIDFFKYAVPESTLEQCQDMKNAAIAIQQSEHIVEQYIKPMDYADEVLSTIQRAGHMNLMLSNTQPEFVRKFAEMVGLSAYFVDFIGLDLHEVTRLNDAVHEVKASAMKKYLLQSPADQTVKIGDRETDIQAGKALNATTYFFRNDFNRKLKLSTRPDHEISDLREVLKELQS